jgi:hypothetical protein
MVSKIDTPGYGYQIKKGATALTEAWDANPKLSQNHCMLGHAEEWLYEFLGGIAPAPGAAGFDKIVFQPQPVAGIDWVETTYRSIRGDVACRWRKQGGQLRIEVRVPVNASAHVHVPANARAEVTDDGAHFLRVEPGRVVYETGSGTYRFSVRPSGPYK